MLEAVQTFIAQAVAEQMPSTVQPSAADVVGQPAAADVVGQPAAALAAAGRPRVGDIGIGKSNKWKDKFNAHKGEVVGLLSIHVKVKMLEGAAKGLEHKYLYKDFTVTEPARVDPPPPPPPSMPPVAEGAFESTQSVSEAAAVATTAAAVAQHVDDMSDAFMEAFAA